MRNIKFNICECHYRFRRVHFLIYQRYILIFMLILAMMNLYGMRYALNDILTYIQSRKNVTLKKVSTEMVLNWSERHILVIKRTFSFGYIVGHLPSGLACDLYGGRRFLMFGIAISAFITFATPSLILYCPWWAMIIRNVFLGLAQGMTMPAFHNLMAHWIPSVILTASSSIGYSGGTLGNLLDQILARRLIENSGSWSWVFYIWGILSLIWVVVFGCYVFSCPVTHPFVSEEERKLIEEEMGVVLPDRIPLKEILTDSGMWALLVGQFGHNWTLYVYTTSLRMYIRENLQINISDNLTVLYCNHLLYWANTCACGLLVNYIIRKELIPTHNVRALFAAIGIIVPSIVLLGITYANNNPNLTIALFVFVLFFKGPINAGLKANIFDITRHYAGTISGLTNGLGGITFALTHDVINSMAPDNTVPQWKKITWMSFAVCCYSYVVFFIWIKGNTASWEFEKKTDRFNDINVASRKRHSV